VFFPERIKSDLTELLGALGVFSLGLEGTIVQITSVAT